MLFQTLTSRLHLCHERVSHIMLGLLCHDLSVMLDIQRSIRASATCQYLISLQAFSIVPDDWCHVNPQHGVGPQCHVSPQHDVRTSTQSEDRGTMPSISIQPQQNGRTLASLQMLSITPRPLYQVKLFLSGLKPTISRSQHRNSISAQCHFLKVTSGPLHHTRNPAHQAWIPCPALKTM